LSPSSDISNPKILPPQNINLLDLVPGIIGLLAHSEGIQSAIPAKKSWPLTGIGNTGDWDNLYLRDGHIVQRHCITGDFRVIEAGGVYQTRFHAKCLIPLLDEIALLPA
jgi:hypothetical protein